MLEAGLASDALERLSATSIDIVFLDFTLPDGDGLTILPKIKELSADTPVIMMMPPAEAHNAVAAIKHGAYLYINKPFNLDEVVILVQRALELSDLRRQVRAAAMDQGMITAAPRNRPERKS